MLMILMNLQAAPKENAGALGAEELSTLLRFYSPKCDLQLRIKRNGMIWKPVRNS